MTEMKKRVFLYLIIGIIVLLFILFTGLSKFPKEVSNSNVFGINIQSQVWSSIIRITEDTTFAPWITLTIKPGTRILFEKKTDVENTQWTKYADEYIITHNDPTGKEGYEASHYYLAGKINAIGTKENPIIFTSAQKKPEYADWDQLVLFRGSILDNVELSYAHNGANLDGNKVVIRNSRLHDSLWSCVDIFSVDNVIDNNEIYHCWHQAIGVKAQGKNTIKNNFVHDALLGVNCENGANPNIADNSFKNADITPECNADKKNKIEVGKPDTEGGTYNGKLIYPYLNDN